MEEVEYLEEYVEEYPNAIPQILNNTAIEEFLPVNEDDRYDLLPVNTNFDEFIEEDPLVSRYRNDFQRNPNSKKVNEITTYNVQKGVIESSTHKESNKGSSKYNYPQNSTNSNRSEIVAKVISCKTIDTSAIRNRSFPFNTVQTATSIHATRKPNLIQATKTTKYSKQCISRNLYGSYTKLNLNKSVDSSLNKIVAVKKSSNIPLGNSKSPTLRGSVNIFGNFNEKIIKYKKENPELFPEKIVETHKLSTPKITARPVSQSLFTNKNNRSFNSKESNSPMFKPNLNIKKFSRYATKPVSPLINETSDKDLSLSVEDVIDGSEVVGEEIVKTNGQNQTDDSDKDSFDGLVETLNEYIEDESNIEEQVSSPEKCNIAAIVPQTIKLDIQPNINENMHYLHINEPSELKMSTNKKSHERSKSQTYEEKHHEEHKITKQSNLKVKIEKRPSLRTNKIENKIDDERHTITSEIKNEKAKQLRKKAESETVQKRESVEKDISMKKSVIKSDINPTTKLNPKKSVQNHSKKAHAEKTGEPQVEIQLENKEMEENKYEATGIKKMQLSGNSTSSEEKIPTQLQSDILKVSLSEQKDEFEVEKEIILEGKSIKNSCENTTIFNNNTATNSSISDGTKKFLDESISVSEINKTELLPLKKESDLKNGIAHKEGADEITLQDKKTKTENENIRNNTRLLTDPISESTKSFERKSDQTNINEKCLEEKQVSFSFSHKNNEEPAVSSLKETVNDQTKHPDEADEIDHILAEIDSVMESIHSDENKPSKNVKCTTPEIANSEKPEIKDIDMKDHVKHAEATISPFTKNTPRFTEKLNEAAKNLIDTHDLKSPKAETRNLENVDNTENCKTNLYRKSVERNKSSGELPSSDEIKANWKAIIKPAKVVLFKTNKIPGIRKSSTEETLSQGSDLNKNSESKSNYELINSLESKKTHSVIHTVLRSRNNSKERVSIEKDKSIGVNSSFSKKENSKSELPEEVKDHNNESNTNSSEVEKPKSCEVNEPKKPANKNEDIKNETEILNDNANDNTNLNKNMKEPIKSIIRTRSNKKCDEVKQHQDSQNLLKNIDQNSTNLELREKKMDVQTDKEVEHIMSIPSISPKETRFEQKRPLVSSNSESGNSDKIFESDNSTVGSQLLGLNSKRRKINQKEKVISSNKSKNKNDTKDSLGDSTDRITDISDLELYFQSRFSHIAHFTRSLDKKNFNNETIGKDTSDKSKNHSVAQKKSESSEKVSRNKKNTESTEVSTNDKNMSKMNDLPKMQQNENTEDQNLKNNRKSIETNKNIIHITSEKKIALHKLNLQQDATFSGDRLPNQPAILEKEDPNIKNSESANSTKSSTAEVTTSEDNQNNGKNYDGVTLTENKLDPLARSDKTRKNSGNIDSINNNVIQLEKVGDKSLENLEETNEKCIEQAVDKKTVCHGKELQNKKESNYNVNKLRKSERSCAKRKGSKDTDYNEGVSSRGVKEVDRQAENMNNKPDESLLDQSNFDKKVTFDEKELEQKQKSFNNELNKTEKLTEEIKTILSKNIDCVESCVSQENNEKDKKSKYMKNKELESSENLLEQSFVDQNVVHKEKLQEFDKVCSNESNELKIKITANKTSENIYCSKNNIKHIFNKEGDILTDANYNEEKNANLNEHNIEISQVLDNEMIKCQKPSNNEFIISNNLQKRNEETQEPSKFTKHSTIHVVNDKDTHNIMNKEEENLDLNAVQNEKEFENKNNHSCNKFNETSESDKSSGDKKISKNINIQDDSGFLALREENKVLRNTRSNKETNIHLNVCDQEPLLRIPVKADKRKKSRESTDSNKKIVNEDDKNIKNVRNEKEMVVKPIDRNTEYNKKNMENKSGMVDHEITSSNMSGMRNKMGKHSENTDSNKNSKNTDFIQELNEEEKKLRNTRRNKVVNESSAGQTTSELKNSHDDKPLENKQTSSNSKINKSKILENVSKNQKNSESINNQESCVSQTVKEKDKNLRNTRNKEINESPIDEISIDQKALRNQNELENKKKCNEEFNNLKRLSKASKSKKNCTSTEFIENEIFEEVNKVDKDVRTMINKKEDNENSNKDIELGQTDSRNKKEPQNKQVSSNDKLNKSKRLEKSIKDTQSSKSIDSYENYILDSIKEEDQNLGSVNKEELKENLNEETILDKNKINKEKELDNERLLSKDQSNELKKLENLDKNKKYSDNTQSFADNEINSSNIISKEKDMYINGNFIGEQIVQKLEDKTKSSKTISNLEIINQIPFVEQTKKTKEKKKRVRYRRSVFFPKKKSRKGAKKNNKDITNVESGSNQNISQKTSTIACVVPENECESKKKITTEIDLQNSNEEYEKNVKKTYNYPIRQTTVKEHSANMKESNCLSDKNSLDNIFLQPEPPSTFTSSALINSPTITRKKSRATYKDHDVKLLASALNESMLIPKSEKRRHGNKDILMAKSVPNSSKNTKDTKPLIRSARIFRRRQSNLVQITRKEYEKVLRENLLKKDKEKQFNNKMLLQKFGILKQLKVKIKRLSNENIRILKQSQNFDDLTKWFENVESKKAVCKDQVSTQEHAESEIANETKSFLEKVDIIEPSLTEKRKQKIKINFIEIKKPDNDNVVMEKSNNSRKDKSITAQSLNKYSITTEKSKRGLITTLPLNDRVSRRDTKEDGKSKRTTRAKSMPRNIKNFEQERNSLQISSYSQSISSLGDKIETCEVPSRIRNIKSKSRTPTPSIENLNNIESSNYTEVTTSKHLKTKVCQKIHSEDKLGEVIIPANKNDKKLKNSLLNHSKKESKKNMVVVEQEDQNQFELILAKEKSEIKEPADRRLNSQQEVNLEDNWRLESQNNLIENEIEFQQENSLKKILSPCTAKSDSTFVSTIVPLNQVKSPKINCMPSNSLNSSNQLKKVTLPTTKSTLKQNGQVRWLPAHIVVETVFMTRDEYDRKNLKKIITPSPPSSLTTQLKQQSLSKIIETPTSVTTITNRPNLINTNNNRDVDSTLRKISDLLENQIKSESQINVNESEKNRRKIQRLNNVNKMRFSNENALQVLIFLQNYFFNVTPLPEPFLKPAPIQQQNSASTFTTVSSSVQSPILSTTITSSQQQSSISVPDSDQCFSFKKILLQKQPNIESNITDQKIVESSKLKPAKRVATPLIGNPICTEPPPKNPRTAENHLQLTNTCGLTFLTSIRKEPEEILPDLENVLAEIKEETPDDTIIM